MRSQILFFALFLTFSSCKKNEMESEASDMKVSAISLPPKENVDAVQFVKPVVAKAEETTNEPSNIIEQKIIKEGDIRFETSDLDETYNQILTALKNQGASIQNDTEGKDYETVFRKLIIRVPCKNFDSFLKEISKGVSYFENKEISSQDVTEEYIDIDARLKAKKVLESRYLELLKKANKVSEMLEIEAQISAIREEIEAKEGQMRYMQNRISYSTITVYFYKNIAESGGVTISYGSKIWNAIKSGFNGISGFIIHLIEIWPLILAVVGIVYFIVKKRIKKKTA